MGQKKEITVTLTAEEEEYLEKLRKLADVSIPKIIRVILAMKVVEMDGKPQ